MERKRIILFMLLSCCIAVLTGFCLKGKSTVVNSEFLEQPADNTDLCLICSVEEYYTNQEQYDLILDDAIIVKIEVVAKHQLFRSIVSEATVIDDYSSNELKNQTIYVIENYTLESIKDSLTATSYSLEMPMVKGRQYLVILKPSSYRKDIYELKMNNLCIWQIDGSEQFEAINDNITLTDSQNQNLIFRFGDLIAYGFGIQDTTGTLAEKYNSLQTKVYEYLKPLIHQ